ncbi:DUF4411 family protein [Macrococcus carouselicus]|uniref:DUF4411 family protein n=1 Tax=Macrococcus carouselicus TaxID=69969 RepID=A0A9Q8CD94_9STAP|nr:DUF4411 family protein [Macrococcus carouselicus]TDL96621.1 DUF4411 family protein [Macrococcus carouselicus]
MGKSIDKADLWLIAVAKVYGYTIVTMEKRDRNLSDSNPTKRELHISDVCDRFEVECIDLFELMRRGKIPLKYSILKIYLYPTLLVGVFFYRHL